MEYVTFMILAFIVILIISVGILGLVALLDLILTLLIAFLPENNDDN